MKNSKQFDLEERTYLFAKRVRLFIKLIPRNLSNIEDSKQLIRASGSVGANYIEANESLSKKDFIHKIKISRKESKEARYWLQLIDTNGNSDINKQRDDLVQEATELMMIFSSIARKI